MAFLAGYKHDIFVSYAHIDDLPIIAKSRGWVSTVVGDLQDLLGMHLGRLHAYSIWMDRRLIGTEPFSAALVENIHESAALVIILSPGYLQSEWCRNERNAFLETIRNKPYSGRRVFVVHTQPTDPTDWPK